MWSPAVSPWFASLILLFTPTFPPGNYTDLEIAGDGSIWILPEGRPELVCLHPSGTVTRHFLEGISLPAGLALDGTGGVLVSDASGGTITVYSSRIQPVSTAAVQGTPGDVVLAGMSVWYLDTERGAVLDTGGLLIARDVPDRGRLFFSRGRGLLTGEGVILVNRGQEPVLLSSTGDGCIAGDLVLLLRDSVLVTSDGDTLLCPVLHPRVSASPDGGTVVLWGGDRPPMVLR